MTSMEDLIKFDNTTWTRRELFDEAFRLINHVQELLLNVRCAHEAEQI
jgi:hypothetical protein